MFCKAESIVKKFYQGIGTFKADVVRTALKICQRKTMSLDEIIDDADFPSTMVLDEEWDIIGKDEMSEARLAKKKHKDWMHKMDCKSIKLYSVGDKGGTEKVMKKKRKAKPKEAEISEEDFKEESRKVLERLKESSPQFDINGHHNIWIVKPAGLSRGRGIEVFDTLVEIIDNCYREGHWVAMKYIENPMLIHNRKFDIRQWVLVTNWNPLAVWFWNEPYVRFPAAEYDPSNLNDRFVHLTNNSVAKYAKNTTSLGQGNMWYIS